MGDLEEATFVGTHPLDRIPYVTLLSQECITNVGIRPYVVGQNLEEVGKYDQRLRWRQTPAPQRNVRGGSTLRQLAQFRSAFANSAEALPFPALDFANIPNGILRTAAAGDSDYDGENAIDCHF